MAGVCLHYTIVLLTYLTLQQTTESYDSKEFEKEFKKRYKDPFEDEQKQGEINEDMIKELTLKSDREQVPFDYKDRAKNQYDLVEKLLEDGYIKDERIKNILISVDRKHYTILQPYEDYPLILGFGGTLNAPHIHAIALHLLEDHLTAGKRVLDVGAASGYMTVCMALMVESTGLVVGIEHMPELKAFTQVCIKKDKPDLLATKRIILIEGDGREGAPEYGPFDAIYVGAIVEVEDTPDALKEQLKKGGRMIVLSNDGIHNDGDYFENIAVYDKHENGSITMYRTNEEGTIRTFSDFLRDKRKQLSDIEPPLTKKRVQEMIGEYQQEDIKNNYTKFR